MTRPVGRPVTKPCGTEAAYKRHRRHHEDPCDPCKAAWAEAQRRYYAKRKGIITKHVAMNTAPVLRLTVRHDGSRLAT